jgi:putative PIN family toxin of toxin-antitoxin system
VTSTQYRLILDTNIVVRAFINLQSASGQILKACQERRIVPLLSRPVLAEYHAILRRPSLVDRYPELRHPRVKDALERILFVSEYHRRVGVHFSFARDPKDKPFLELAIAASATHLITTDEDMLSLSNRRDDSAKRFRQRVATRFQRPEEFIAAHPDAVARLI